MDHFTSLDKIISGDDSKVHRLHAQREIEIRWSNN